VLPALGSTAADYRIFLELKSNLTKEQMSRLFRAGVRSVLPGIETLDDELLGLMAKGNSAVANVEVLKWGRELGMYMHWIMLMAIPGEEPAAYRRICELIPRIHHLQPPNCLSPVEYHRFSPYAERPREYGLSLRPFHGYAAIYPPGAAEDPELAYYFVDAEGAKNRQMEQPQLGARLEAWRTAFWEHDASLTMEEDTILDTRRPGVEKRTQVDGVVRELLGACHRSKLVDSLRKSSTTRAGGSGERELEEAIGYCRDNGWILERGKRILSLVVERASTPKWLDYKAPNGRIAE
jgi:hypothetical protein